MKFHVVASLGAPTSVGADAYLVREDWDDWFKYETRFRLVLFWHGEAVDAGRVKIGKVGLTPDQRRPDLNDTFSKLKSEYFSLGQDETYYETLSRFREKTGVNLFKLLRDCAYDLTLFQKVQNEDVTETSLLRSVSVSLVRGRFNRLANGDAKLTPYNFAYCYPKTADDPDPQQLDFQVIPASQPPTNVHTLIGRNGVGKTRCLTHITHALLGLQLPNNEQLGKLLVSQEDFLGDQSALIEAVPGSHGFSNLVSVSFSAFDPFDPPSASTLSKAPIQYTYVGLKKSGRSAEDVPAGLKSRDELCEEFIESVQRCSTGPRAERWRRALAALETDPLFKEKEISTLLDVEDPTEEREWAIVRHLFKHMSSGHGIVLLTMTRLVDLVDEKTLVFLDEPEGHLHPPLLSAFVRALSDLLTQRNGVALIATHSPVVLQETPKSCAWYIQRSGNLSWADRPETETFGENVGVLTRDVFGLEVVKSGFHQMIVSEVKRQNGDYDSVLAAFDNSLGGEARSLAKALCNIELKKLAELQS